MQLIGYGEERRFGSPSQAYAIFQKATGETFHLPLDVRQLATLLAESGEIGNSPAPSPVRPPPAPEPPGVRRSAPPTVTSLRDDMSDDDEDLPPLRIGGTVNGSLHDGDQL